MKILMVPMPVNAKTEGPHKRVHSLAEAFKKENFEIATCAALDCNFKVIDNVHNYYLPVPSPLGLPSFIGNHMFSFAEKSGIKKRKSVSSFEQVLFFTGAISEKYFRKNIECVRNAIKDFKPDLVYSEFNLGAIIAAKLENVKIFSGYSYPVQTSYACSPQFAKGVNKVLAEYNLKRVKSCLDLFLYADKLIIPSSYELEPIENDKAVFTGPYEINNNSDYSSYERKNIAAYMGSGTISNKKLIKFLKEAFYNTEYEVYIAASDYDVIDDKNIHIAPRHDFSKILPYSSAFINHGGQNSIMDGLKYGVPQIVCPGKIFERKYNAHSIEENKAGIVVDYKEFDSKKIKQYVDIFKDNNKYMKNAEKLWKSIKKLGGADRVIEEVKKLKY